VPNGDGYTFSSEKAVINKFLGFEDEKKARARFEYEYPNGKTACAEYEICGEYVTVKCSSDNGVALMLPAFSFDGENHTDITLSRNTLAVEYMGWIWEYTSDQEIYETEKIGRNRNGYYKAYCSEGKNSLSLKINIRRKDI
jgi:hypothetical protein